MDKDCILAVRCPNCGDWYRLDNNFQNHSYFLTNSTDCWVCRAKYIPITNSVIMYDFVFSAMKRIKGF